tara:strand:+ start:304 stop:564 length:261 start_codon:yes stop_codon:yes gene_type:complete
MKKAYLGFFRIFLAISVALILTSCQTSGGGYGYSKPETPQCRAARSQYQICYGNCLTVTPGGVLAAMGKCGNKCMNYSMQVAAMCN